MPDIVDLRKARREYDNHRFGAKTRGIGFELSFEQWCDIWEQSGKYPKRGRRSGQYGMQRYWDDGPYRVGNVEIGTPADNRRTYSNRRIYRKVRADKQYQSRSERSSFIDRSLDYQSPEEIMIAEEEFEMS